MFFLLSGTLLCCATASLTAGYASMNRFPAFSLAAASSTSSMPVILTIPSLSSFHTLTATNLSSVPVSSTSFSVLSSVPSTRRRITLTAEVTRTIVTTVRPLPADAVATRAPSTLATTVAGDTVTVIQRVGTLVQVTATVMVAHLQYLTVHQTQATADKPVPSLQTRTTTLSTQEDILKAFRQTSLAEASPATTQSSSQPSTITLRTTVTNAQSSASSTVFPVTSISALPKLQFSPGGVVILSGTAATLHVPFILVIVSCMFSL